MFVCTYIEKRARRRVYYQKSMPSLSPRVDKGDTALLSAPLLMMPGRKTRTSLYTKAKSGIARTTLSAAGSECQGAPSVSPCV